MQHLDRRFEHFHKLKHAAIGETEPAGIAISVWVMLRIFLKFADVDLAHQRRNILIIFIAWLRLGNGNLLQHRWMQFDDAELADVAIKFVQALYCPWRHDGVEVAPRNAEV